MYPKVPIPAQTGRTGFSTVELLVVMAILAVLAAILIPLTGKFRARSEAASCLSNLRFIGASIQMYHNEHGGTLPSMVVARDSKHSPEPAMDNVLAPYVDDQRIFRCPADTEDFFGRTGSSYGWNFLLNGQTMSQLALQFSEENPITEDPTRIPLVFDKESFHRKTNKPVNYLYADGSSAHELRPFTE